MLEKPKTTQEAGRSELFVEKSALLPYERQKRWRRLIRRDDGLKAMLL
jgi:hypothetical protein